ncbi:hypothetical protein F5887DRAFT_916072 [Amanita rubescens]|nr:hypothetical protein F5887DRAFT_916072 [Amanita rubescens]
MFQKLGNLYNKFGTEAILLILREDVNPDEQDRDDLAQFLESEADKFIYKGNEDLHNSSYSMLIASYDSTSKLASFNTRYSLKHYLPSWGTWSIKFLQQCMTASCWYLTDFSWEPAAQQYMRSIMALSDQRTLEIFKQIYHLMDWLGRRNAFVQVDSKMSNSARASLHPDDEDLKAFGRHGLTMMSTRQMMMVSTLMPFGLDVLTGPPVLAAPKHYSGSSSGWRDHRRPVTLIRTRLGAIQGIAGGDDVSVETSIVGGSGQVGRKAWGQQPLPMTFLQSASALIIDRSSALRGWFGVVQADFCIKNDGLEPIFCAPRSPLTYRVLNYHFDCHRAN